MLLNRDLLKVGSTVYDLDEYKIYLYLLLYILGSFGDVTAKVTPGSPSFGINAQRVKVGKASGQLAAFKLNGVTSQWVKTTDISPKKVCFDLHWSLYK